MKNRQLTSLIVVAAMIAMVVPPAWAGAEDDNWTFSHINPSPTANTLYTVAWKPFGAYALIGGARGDALVCNGTTFFSFPSATMSDLRGASWTPDGSKALIAGMAGTLRLFDGNAITTINTGTFNDLRAAAWAPDGSYALIVGAAGTVLRYNGTVSAIISGASSELTGVAWAPDGSYALIVGRLFAGTATVLTFNGTGFTTLTNTITQDLRGVAFAPNGTEALAVGSGGQMHGFNGTGFTQVASGVNQNLNGVAYAPNGTLALVCGDAGALLRYSSGAVSAVTSTVNSNLYSVSWEFTGQFALVAGTNGMVLKYSGAVTRLYVSTTQQNLNDAEWHPDGSYALIVGAQGTVLRYDGTAFTTVNSNTASELRGISWNPTGTNALIVGRRTGGGGNQQYLLLNYDNATGAISRINIGGGGGQDLWDVDYNPNGSMALLVGNNRVVLRYDPATGLVTNLNNPLGQEWHGVDWRPDGSSALIVGLRGPEIISATPGATWTFTTVANAVYDDLNRVAWRNNTYALMSGIVDPNTNQGILLRYDTNLNPAHGAMVSGALDALWGIGWKPTGNYSLVAGYTATVLKFNLTAPAILRPSTGEDLTGVAWKPDGSYAILTGTLGTVLKWAPAGPPAPNTPPTVTITYPMAGPEVHGTILVCGTAADPDLAPLELSRVIVKVDNGAFFAPSGLNSWNFSLDTTTLSNGAHTIRAMALDSWANSTMASVTFTVNNTVNFPPRINITSPSEGAIVSGSVTIGGIAFDNDSADSIARVVVRIGNSPYVNASGTATWSLDWNTTLVTDGAYTIRAIAYDASRMEPSVEALINVTVRNTVIPDTPPGVDISLPAEGAVVNGTVDIRGTAWDNDVGDIVTSVFVRFDGAGDWALVNGTGSWSYPWNTTKLANGPHSIQARSLDGRLNFSAEKLRNVTVSNVNLPPLVTIDMPAQWANVSGTVTVLGTAKDQDSGGSINGVFIRIDGGSWAAAIGTGTWSYDWNTTQVMNGLHLIQAMAFDGMLNSTVVTCNVTVANPLTSPPKAFIVSMSPNPAVRGQNVTITGRGEDDGTIGAYLWTSSIDGNLSTAASFGIANLSVGNHTIILKVQDNVGLWSAEVCATLTINPSETPVRNFTVDAGGNRAAFVGDSISFIGHASVTNGTLVQFRWDFGDGQYWTGGNNSEVRHAYLKKGVFTVKFSVRDEIGGSAEVQLTVTVSEKAKPVKPATDNNMGMAVVGIVGILALVCLAMLYVAWGRKRNAQDDEVSQAPASRPEDLFKKDEKGPDSPKDARETKSLDKKSKSPETDDRETKTPDKPDKEAKSPERDTGADQKK